MGKGRSGKTTSSSKQNIGNAVKIINMSGENQYCTYTQRVLPKKGFAWQYKDQLFISKTAAIDYENSINPPGDEDEKV
jgi:hypothetical protein